MVHRKALAQRIMLEVDELEQVNAVIVRHWTSAQTITEDKDAFLNSVALSLHSFYNGLERVMELVAVEMDGGTLGGAAWHSELLRQMTLEVPSVRPAVLSTDTGRRLNQYRKFRHRVRNIYTTHLDAARIGHLVDSLPQTWQQARTELLAFVEFLERLETDD
ncbi:MAG: antitoxin [Anaerolineae bacterium]|jgi:hypothetical protein|nr:antitoxin [Anaerolineae bacterium]